MHDRFPGFLAEPTEVFEALWERRTTARIAHRDVPCPDVLAHGAVAALHWLRDGWSEATREKLDFLVRCPRTAAGRRRPRRPRRLRRGAPGRPSRCARSSSGSGSTYRSTRARHDLVADPDRVDRDEERGLGGRAARDAAAPAAGSALARPGADRGGDPKRAAGRRPWGVGAVPRPAAAPALRPASPPGSRPRSSGARGVARDHGVAHRSGGRLGRQRGRTGWPSSTSTGSKSRRSC